MGQRTKRKFKAGFLTWMFILMYGILRTIVNFWRNDKIIFLGVFGTGQILSMIMALIATYVLVKYYWLKPRRKEKELKNKKNNKLKKTKKKKGKKND